MNQVLKDCPRCKGQADVCGTKKMTGDYWIECSECQAKTKRYPKRNDAEDAWNDNKLIN